MMAQYMSEQHNIRNITLISFMHHGKTTLTDLLLAAFGIIECRTTAPREHYNRDHWDNRAQLNFSVRRAVSSMLCTLPPYLGIPKDSVGSDFLINLIVGPKHFSPEQVIHSLRISDGFLIIADFLEDVRSQTENALRLAVSERLVPALVLNKMDTAFQLPKTSLEDIYQLCLRTIHRINATFSTTPDDLLGDVTIHPEKGNVCFCSALQGWGFTLNEFARLYASKFGVDETKMVQRLWGDNYYDPEAKKWTCSDKSESGKPLSRAFCKFVLEPIAQMHEAVMSDNKERVDKMLEKLKIKLNKESQSLVGTPLFKEIMRTWLPASEALKEVMVLKMPSPVAAQQYRVNNLYTGPQDDISAAAIRTCDPQGPLVVYVSTMVPATNGRFAAIGRVFSGTLTSGASVRIMGPNYQVGKTEDLYVKKVPTVLAVMMGCYAEIVETIPAGNACVLMGIDQYLLHTATLGNDETTHPIVNIRYTTSPVIRVAVEPKNPADLPTLVEALKRLAKTDGLATVFMESSGEAIVAGCSESHLESCLINLEEFAGGVKLNSSQYLVTLNETISDTSPICLSKSPNKHNRLYCTASPFREDLMQALHSGEITHSQDPKERAKILVEQYSWDMDHARRIWSFGPDIGGQNNILVDATKAVQYLHEIKDYVNSAFQWVTREGVLVQEPLRGVRFNIMDVIIVSDAVHRGGGQVIPTARRVFYACQLSAKPRLMEPIYSVDISCPPSVLANVYTVIHNREGQIIEEQLKRGSPLATVRCYLPALHSFGFVSDLDSATGGHAFSQCLFDHWKVIPEDPLDDSTRAGALVVSTRKRKGLAEQVPSLDRFLDKL